MSDLKNRVALINALPHAVLLSIHQNSMPQHPAVHGAQVFSNPQEPAAGLAQSIQQALNLTVNTGNEKTAKAIGDSVYLMKHITCAASCPTPTRRSCSDSRSSRNVWRRPLWPDT